MSESLLTLGSFQVGKRYINEYLTLEPYFIHFETKANRLFLALLVSINIYLFNAVFLWMITGDKKPQKESTLKHIPN